MRNHHNQSDNAPYYVISRASFRARVFCINRLSYYVGGGMTHTCRKVTQILYFTLISCIFSSFKAHSHIQNIRCVAGATWGVLHHSVGRKKHLLHKVRSGGHNQPAARQSIVSNVVILPFFVGRREHVLLINQMKSIILPCWPMKLEGPSQTN